MMKKVILIICQTVDDKRKIFLISNLIYLLMTNSRCVGPLLRCVLSNKQGTQMAYDQAYF